MKKNIFLLFVFLFAASLLYAVEINAEKSSEILNKIDSWRKYSNEGFSFEYQVDDDFVMSVFLNKKDYSKVIAQYKAPKKFARRRLFSDNGTYWMMDSNMNAPIKISSSQMLNGDASVGDILNIVFEKSYNITSYELTEAENILRLTLDAKKDTNVSYPHIVIDVTKDSLKPISAALYSRTNKLLKTIYYDKYNKHDGVELLSEFTLVNENNKNKTKVILTNYNKETLNDRFFSKEGLKILR